MKYTVRTKEGELQFDSLGDIDRAFRNGMVEPDDEVLVPGGTTWRKASSFPAFAVHTRKSSLTQIPGLGLIVGAIVISIGALASLFSGRPIVAGVAAVIVVFLLFRVTSRTFRTK